MKRAEERLESAEAQVAQRLGGVSRSGGGGGGGQQEEGGGGEGYEGDWVQGWG